MFEPQAAEGTATGPRAILRVLQVLEHLARYPQGSTLSGLCDQLGVPKTTLFTMLKTLQGSGHLECTAGVYRLGPPALTLGAAMASGMRRNFPSCADPILQSLSRRTGETSFLAVLTPDGMSCRYVSVVESGNWLRFSVQPGSLKPAYATGTGQAMLAYLPQIESQAILGRVKFEKLTRKTVGSRRALLATLEQVRQHRVSITDSGTVADVMSVAAPIFDASRRVTAAVSAGGPAARMVPHLGAIQRAVRWAAEDISRTLGLAGDWPPA